MTGAELPGGERSPRWPAWFAPVGFAAAFLVLAVVVGTLGAVVGVDSDDPAPEFTLTGTLIQDAVLLGTALLLARTVARPEPWQFGLRRVPFRPALGWAVAAGVSFYALTALYSVIVRPDGEQSIVEDLGADESTALLIATAVLVVGIAPFVEELFFRAFFYGALRSRFGMWTAAALAGLLFGAIHYSGPDTLTLLPPLALLGTLLCLLYERTGSLYPAIGLHAFNNTVALSVQTDGDGVAAAVAIGLASLGACIALPRRQVRDAPSLFGRPAALEEAR